MEPKELVDYIYSYLGREDNECEKFFELGGDVMLRYGNITSFEIKENELWVVSKNTVLKISAEMVTDFRKEE